MSSSGLARLPLTRRPQVTSKLTLSSSNRSIVDAFEWAKKEALSYVNTGDAVGPWIEASLPGRFAFCMRDTSHQVAGEFVLGMNGAVYNMLYKFAVNAKPSRRWCSYWEINRDDKPAPIDYSSDSDFWYDLPASFDVMDACFRMYLWSGDKRYVDNPVFVQFYKHTLTDYVREWHLEPGQLMTRPVMNLSTRYAEGIPTYDESTGDIRVGLDLLASECAAFRDGAAIATLNHESDVAKVDMLNEGQLRRLIEKRWFNLKNHEFYAHENLACQLVDSAKWAALFWGVVTNASEVRSEANAIASIPLRQDYKQVEDKSYYAEILYRYGRNERATEQLLDLSRKGRFRNTYPEVSYSVLGAITQGLMGIRTVLGPTRPNSPMLLTLSGLPQNTKWAVLRNVPVLETTLSVGQYGFRKTTLENQGKKGFCWRAEFVGYHQLIEVNGKKYSATFHKDIIGRTISSVDIQVKGLQTLSATVSA